MEEFPKVDAQKAADEIKSFLNQKKMELVDWGYWNIECYPDPTSDDYPELKRFAAMWDDFFKYADTITEEDGAGFPNEVVLRYEDETRRIESAVNSDQEFWKDIQAEILPLYVHPDPPKAELELLDKFIEVWPTIREEAFKGVDVDASDMIEEMQFIVKYYDLVGRYAKHLFKQAASLEKDLSADEFMLLCRRAADRIMEEKWTQRWQQIKLFYDPVGMVVKTTKILKNKNTGVQTRGEVVNERELPPGFVVKIL